MSVTVITRSASIEALHADGRLAGILETGSKLVLVDAAYYGLPETAAARGFVDSYGDDIVVHATDIGAMERMRQLEGAPRYDPVEAVAETQFLASEDGVKSYLATGGAVTVILSPEDFRAFNTPVNLQLVHVDDFTPDNSSAPGL